MARSPYLAYKFRNHAVSGVHLSGAGRLFLLLTILLSLVGGSYIGVQAAADTAHVAAAPAGAITYIGDIGCDDIEDIWNQPGGQYHGGCCSG